VATGATAQYEIWRSVACISRGAANGSAGMAFAEPRSLFGNFWRDFPGSMTVPESSTGKQPRRAGRVNFKRIQCCNPASPPHWMPQASLKLERGEGGWSHVASQQDAAWTCPFAAAHPAPANDLQTWAIQEMTLPCPPGSDTFQAFGW